jgi:hypothetical protein
LRELEIKLTTIFTGVDHIPEICEQCGRLHRSQEELERDTQREIEAATSTETKIEAPKKSIKKR